MLPVFPQELQNINEVDPYYNNVLIHIPGEGFHVPDTCELLIHGESGNGYTVFTDSSKNNRTVTRNGNTVISTGSVAPVPYGETSIYFDGNGDYLTIADTASLDMTGDFTVETWVNAAATQESQYAGLIGFRDSGTVPPILYLDTGKAAWYYNGAFRITGTTDLRDAGWNHLAVVRKNGVTKLYVNGIQEGSDYVESSTYQPTGIWIGSIPSVVTQDFAGYLKDIAIFFHAKYVSNFTPPTEFIKPIHVSNDPFWYNTEFQLVSSGKDNETIYGDLTNKRNFTAGTFGTVIDRAVSFNGTSNYMQMSNIAFGTNDFTIEVDIYNTRSNSNGEQVISEQYTGAGDYTWALGYYTDGKIGFGWYNGSAWTWVQDTVTSPYNSWLNVKAIRKNGVLYLYLNNSLVNSGACTYNFPTDDLFYIGRRWDTAGTFSYFQGYIKNLRITKNIARLYSNSINTREQYKEIKGHLVIPSSSIYPATFTNNSKFKSSSLYFNGTDSRLVIYSGDDWLLGTKDFTLETWIRQESGATTYGAIFLIGTGQTTGVNFKYANTSTYNFYIYNGPTSTALCSSANNTVKIGVWQYVVYQRRNGVFYIYVDGVLSGYNSSYTGTSIGVNNANPGLGWSGNTTEYLKGNIEDFRFTLGKARYFGNRIRIPNNSFPTRGGNI